MAIPDYQSLMLPLLKFLADKEEHKTREAVEKLSDEFNLSEEERKELLPSGQQPIIDNRVGWARTYMLKADLLSAPKRGYIKITDKGLDVLKQNPEKINIKFLEQFSGFNEFRNIKKEISNEKNDNDNYEESDPIQLIEKGYNIVKSSLAQELLEKLRSVNPYEFEKIIGKLLSAMGYGEFEETTKSNDGGIDGIINQDELGLDKIFFQAKRYAENNSVTASNVRDFVGTLALNKVQKGIFITTSKFPKDTENILERAQKTIILINGTRLANLMIKYNIGISIKNVYNIKEIDSDFFDE